MKHLLLFVLTLFCTLTIDAQTFVTVDNVRYLIEDDHAVVARQDRELTGIIIIPASIEYDNTSYNVTRIMTPYESESGNHGAFYQCEITGITLPEGITEIPDHTFMDCRQLSSVTFNGAITRIGNESFTRCESLSTIDLPDDVTEIGINAFWLSGLTEFRIPAGVEVLSRHMLSDTKITYLEIPASVNYISTSALAINNRDEQEQLLGVTVKMLRRDCRLIEVANGAFGDVTVVDLQVPAGGKVVYQEYEPWMYMNSITEYGEITDDPLELEQRHVTIDGIRYFLNDGEAHVDIQLNPLLSGEITIPEKITYEEIDYPVTTIMDAYTSEYFTVTVFSRTQVTRVTLPNSIKRIGLNAFGKAKYLQEVVLNEGITEIGSGAFADCTALTTINIPSTLTVLEDLFPECHNLKNITIPEGITTLGPMAFYNSGIETLTIPSTCTTFGRNALYLPNLKTLIMKVKEPTDIRYLDQNYIVTMTPFVFYSYWVNEDYNEQELWTNVDIIVPLGCADSYRMIAPWYKFRSITEEGTENYQPKNPPVNIDGINYILHETVNELEEVVRTATIAQQNPSLSGDIVIPEKVSYAKKVLQNDEWVTLEPQEYDVTEIFTPIIEAPWWDDDREIECVGAFQECAITSISLPSTITTIPNNTFYGCQQLKSVTLPEGITIIRAGAFSGCSSLEEIYLPETITHLGGEYVFSNCTNLKKVNIPNLVTGLDRFCFSNSGIETFIIPKNVTFIGEGCFSDNLKSIKICHDSYSDGSISFSEGMFNDVSSITLIVPEGTKESLYSQVYPWKNFGNIIEYKDQDDEHQYNAYSVSYEEEVIGHEQEASDDTSILDYIPSGVDTNLPEDTEKEDYVLIDWHDILGNAPHTIMPAQDMRLRLTLALLGDANRDGDVDVSDFLSVANHILGRGPIGFLHKAANTSKGDNEIDVADFLGVANIILRGVHYVNPHHAPARRTASITDISTMDNAIYIEPTSVCVGLEQKISVKMKNANPVAGFEFILQLPEGITVTGAHLSNERTTDEKTSMFNHAVMDDGSVKVLCGTMVQNPETGKLYTFDGNDGEVATITISVDQDLELGNYSAIITNAKLADADAEKTTISGDVESVITVSDVLILDENSTVTPPTGENVTVTVRRTINANEWSTICLPFDMTEEQVKAAFGDDVKLAMFSSYNAVKDGNNVTGITINFDNADLADGLYGNYPYIIKTSSNITEFTLTTNVAPADAVANFITGSGPKQKISGRFIGTYQANTVVPDNSLFISGNKFWYSAGLTKMKAFRAYFTLDDVLAEVLQVQAGAQIQISLDEGTTSVNERTITNRERLDSEKYYNLMGQRVTKPKKGLFVKDGKKIVIK